MVSVSQDLSHEWDLFTQDVELARNWMYADARGSSRAPNPVLDMILPSLLYIEAVSLLDAGLGEWMVQAGEALRSGVLHAKLSLAKDRGILKCFEELDRIRLRRNDLGHQRQRRVTWAELDTDRAIIQGELVNLNLIVPPPDYAFVSTSGRFDSSTDPDALMEAQCSFGLKVNGELAICYEWVEKVMRREV